MGYDENAPAQWNRLLKKRMGINDAVIVAVNLLPLYGVWFLNWNAKEMFLVYCLESMVAGGYTILQMMLTAFFKKRDVWDEKTGAMMPGYAFILFFVVHYGFFISIQLNIFLSVLHYPGLEGFGSGFRFLLHFPRYLGKEGMTMLWLFIFSYGIMIVRKYLWTGRYKTTSLGILMFTPYPRIFVQQFVVIIGSFILAFGDGASKIFMLVFVLVKIFFELFLDYDRLTDGVGEHPTEKFS